MEIFLRTVILSPCVTVIKTKLSTAQERTRAQRKLVMGGNGWDVGGIGRQKRECGTALRQVRRWWGAWHVMPFHVTELLK